MNIAIASVGLSSHFGAFAGACDDALPITAFLFIGMLFFVAAARLVKSAPEAKAVPVERRR